MLFNKTPRKTLLGFFREGDERGSTAEEVATSPARSLSSPRGAAAIASSRDSIDSSTVPARTQYDRTTLLPAQAAPRAAATVVTRRGVAAANHAATELATTNGRRSTPPKPGPGARTVGSVISDSGSTLRPPPGMSPRGAPLAAPSPRRPAIPAAPPVITPAQAYVSRAVAHTAASAQAYLASTGSSTSPMPPVRAAPPTPADSSASVVTSPPEVDIIRLERSMRHASVKNDVQRLYSRLTQMVTLIRDGETTLSSRREQLASLRSQLNGRALVAAELLRVLLLMYETERRNVRAGGGANVNTASTAQGDVIADMLTRTKEAEVEHAALRRVDAIVSEFMQSICSDATESAVPPAAAAGSGSVSALLEEFMQAWDPPPVKPSTAVRSTSREGSVVDDGSVQPQGVDSKSAVSVSPAGTRASNGSKGKGKYASVAARVDHGQHGRSRSVEPRPEPVIRPAAPASRPRAQSLERPPAVSVAVSPSHDPTSVSSVLYSQIGTPSRIPVYSHSRAYKRVYGVNLPSLAEPEAPLVKPVAAEPRVLAMRVGDSNAKPPTPPPPPPPPASGVLYRFPAAAMPMQMPTVLPVPGSGGRAAAHAPTLQARMQRMPPLLRRGSVQLARDGMRARWR